MLDRELADLAPEARWREWRMRVEAAIFAAAAPLPAEALAALIGRACPLEPLLAEIRAELRARPYELARIGGGYVLRTRAAYGEAVRAALGLNAAARGLTPGEAGVLAAIAYEQPITRAELGERFGREIGRDLIAALRDRALIAAGPRAPRPGAPVAYVTTPRFLEVFGLATLADLPDLEALADAGLGSP